MTTMEADLEAIMAEARSVDSELAGGQAGKKNLPRYRTVGGNYRFI